MTIEGTYEGRLYSWLAVKSDTFTEAGGGSYSGDYTKMEIGDSIRYHRPGSGNDYKYYKDGDPNLHLLDVRMTIVSATNLDYINPSDPSGSTGFPITFKSADPTNSVTLKFEFVDHDTGEIVNLKDGKFSILDVDHLDRVTADGNSGTNLQLHQWVEDETGAGGTNFDYTETTSPASLTLKSVNSTYNDTGSGGIDYLGTSWAAGRTSVTFTVGTPEKSMGIGFRDDQGETVVTAACFVRGTMISAGRGAVPVEDLSAGDLVLTSDHGLRPLRWVGSKRLTKSDLCASPNLRPIRISSGALGAGIPSADLIVSPQHRILVRSKIAQRMFGAAEVLVAARQLLGIDGVEIARDTAEVEYFHFLFDCHEIVLANGAEAESLYTGAQALLSLDDAEREEIFALFPQLKNPDPVIPPSSARPLVPGKNGRKLTMRHIRNHVSLVSEAVQ